MAYLLASDWNDISWFLLLIYGPVILGGMLLVAVVGSFIYSSIKGRRR